MDDEEAEKEGDVVIPDGEELDIPEGMDDFGEADPSDRWN